jgi:hypothetical protein
MSGLVPRENLIQQIIANEVRRVDFDLDNWINDFEDGFPRFVKINPRFKDHYWGQGFSNRPRIKELNEQADAQQVEGYRVIEFFPDRENKDESYLLMGSPPALMSQVSLIMNLHLMNKTGGGDSAWVGYPLDEYLRAKPRTGITIQVMFTTYKRPPYYQIGNRWFSRRYLTIPLVDRSKITYSSIRTACGGAQGQNWGEWTARAYLSLDEDSKGIHQMVCGGSTESTAIRNLEKFLEFTQCKLRKITTHKIDYTKGDALKDPDRARYSSFDVYPAWITVWNTKLVQLDDARRDGKKTLSGRMLSKHNKLFTYQEREPANWTSTLRELFKKGDDD